MITSNLRGVALSRSSHRYERKRPPLDSGKGSGGPKGPNRTPGHRSRPNGSGGIPHLDRGSAIDPVIYVGFCHPGMVHTQWMESIFTLTRDLPCIVQGAETGPLISRARNIILERFLQTEADYILCTDTDTVFESGDVRLLLEADKPIVGALYYGILGGNPNSTFPVALTYQNGVLQSLDQAPSGLTRVDAVGMGLTLIRREVVEALEPSSELNKPFAEGIYEQPDGSSRHHGEDAIFCLEAAKLGFETWLEPKARIGHRKTVVL